MSVLMSEIDSVPRVFTADEAQAADSWFFNCGPAALCAVTGLTPEQVRPHMGDFEEKRYTNPSLMVSALMSMRVPFRKRYECHVAVTKPPVDADWPRFGLARIQWGGPWTKRGVPIRVRYRKTHWIATADFGSGRGVFDINAIAAGGWISWNDWVESLVPWILKSVPKSDGQFWPTHCWEIERPNR